MIKIARRNAEEAGVAAQLHFEIGNANNLRFNNDSYDMITSTGALHSWRNPTKVIGECHRVLKSGKEAWIYDPARIVTKENVKSWKESLKGWDWIAYKCVALTSNIPPQVYSVKEIQQIIYKTQFRDYEITEDGWIRIKLKK